MHYKPTDSHSYLLYSSSHPSHVKNSIPYSQFLRLRRLCSEDSDFSLKSEKMCEFFDRSGYSASVVQAGHHRAQQIDRQSALQTSQKENNNRIPFTLTFYPHNHAVKSIFLKIYKLLQNDPDTGRIFVQLPLISFKRDKNMLSKRVTNPVLLNAHAHDAKHVLSFATLRNRPFAGSSHMVRNKLHWDANDAVGLSKQRNSYQSSPTFLCFESPTASFASQCNLFRTM